MRMFAVSEMFAIFAKFANFANFDPFVRTPEPGRQDTAMPWPVLPFSAPDKRPYHPGAHAGGISCGMRFVTTEICPGVMV